MPRKAHQYHYIYKITNFKNNKYYIGMHSTSNLDDGYMGGGVRIRNSIRKHGKEVHQKEILQYLPDRTSLAAKEKEIVNEDLLKDQLCMNLKVGGEGGWLLEWQKKGAQEMLKNVWKDPEFIKRKKLKSSEISYKLWQSKEYREKMIESAKTAFLGKNHSKEFKERIGIINSEKQTGSGNSQYGTFWITNGIENKKCNKDTLENYILNGWKKGRILKK